MNVISSGSTQAILKQDAVDAQENLQRASAESEQIESKEKLGEAEDIININARFEKGLAKASKSEATKKAEQAKESVLISKDEADGLAGQFSQKDGNRQYRLDKNQLSKILQKLGGKDLNENSDIRSIIETIRVGMAIGGRLPDVGQVDKVFDFLLEVLDDEIKKGTPRAEAIKNKILEAKTAHMNENQAAIEQAHRLIDLSDIIVEGNKVDTPETLAHLRDVIHNPQDLSTIFNHYRSKGYNYQQMKTEIDAVLSYLGREFKRTDIPTAEMDTLMKETRKSQAILQIFRYFKKASSLGERLFDLKGLTMPRNLR